MLLVSCTTIGVNKVENKAAATKKKAKRRLLSECFWFLSERGAGAGAQKIPIHFLVHANGPNYVARHTPQPTQFSSRVYCSYTSMPQKRLLMIVGDFVEDYEAMVPFQVGCICSAQCMICVN